MKTLDLNQMEEIIAEGDGQDFVSGILCGVALGSSIATGGWGIGLAIIGCATLFGDW